MQQQAHDIFTGSTTRHIAAPEVAPNLTGLIPGTDPTRSEGTQTQAEHQFKDQQVLFPGPPPPTQSKLPLQQAQGIPRKSSLSVNSKGIPRLIIPFFDGKLSEYQKFKLTFNTAYDNRRNLPKQLLVLLLDMSLQGIPLKLISDLTRTGIDDQSYARMWQLLDDRFGDKKAKDKFTVSLFKETLPIKNGSLTEVERIYVVFLVQHAYYLIKDEKSLRMKRSPLFKSWKEKLNDEFSIKFVCFAEKYKLVPNFTALITFMQAKFLFAQKEEREHALSSHKSDITFIKKLFENLNLNDDAKALPKCSDLADHQGRTLFLLQEGTSDFKLSIFQCIIIHSKICTHQTR
jgi:hypothetical protein